MKKNGVVIISMLEGMMPGIMDACMKAAMEEDRNKQIEIMAKFGNKMFEKGKGDIKETKEV